MSTTRAHHLSFLISHIDILKQKYGEKIQENTASGDTAVTPKTSFSWHKFCQQNTGMWTAWKSNSF